MASIVLFLRGQLSFADEDRVEALRHSGRQLDGGHGLRSHCLGIPHADLCCCHRQRRCRCCPNWRGGRGGFICCTTFRLTHHLQYCWRNAFDVNCSPRTLSFFGGFRRHAEGRGTLERGTMHAPCEGKTMKRTIKHQPICHEQTHPRGSVQGLEKVDYS